MRLNKPVTVQWIADFISAELIGNASAVATGINEIHKVEKGDIVFVDHPKYYDTCINSPATVILINKKTDFPDEKTLLVVDDPFEAYLKLVNHFRPFVPSSKSISDSANIGKIQWSCPIVLLVIMCKLEMIASFTPMLLFLIIV